jgi:iron complex outermembrane receptor protein
MCPPNAAMSAARLRGTSQVKRYTSSVAAAALILAGSVAATAQDAAQGQPVQTAAKPAPEAEEIIITGSRIKRTDLVSESPVALIGADEIQQQAAVNVEDVIRALPQAAPGVSPGVNNGNPGAATINLRGLDDERTLVLVDGKRFVGYDSEGIVDVNNIPTPLIERIDVVTGGASAVYGSDAIAGVVNFVLKDDFEGVQIDYDYTNALRGSEATHGLSATIGGNLPDERGNITLSASWTQRDAVTQGDRWFSERAITTADGSFGGSSTDTNGNILCGGCSYSGGGGPTFGPQTYVGFQSANGVVAPRGSRRFNYNPFNLLQVPEERYTGTALGHYDINEWVTAYGHVLLGVRHPVRLDLPHAAGARHALRPADRCRCLPHSLRLER